MFTISFGLDLKKIEDLIMATRSELADLISTLAVSVSDEALVVEGAIKGLEDVAKGLTDKVAALEVEIKGAADLTPEMEALAKVKDSIKSIYTPAAVPVPVIPVAPIPVAPIPVAPIPVAPVEPVPAASVASIPLP